jgi:hypothetical protein
MDTQFIGSGEAAKATVFYTTEYITKGDLPLHVGLQALEYATKMSQVNSSVDLDMTTERNDRKLITKTVNAIMGKQEMSHQQIMSYLVGGGDHYSSHTFRTFRWFEFVNAIQNIDDADSTLDEEGVANHVDDCDETINEEQITVNIAHNKIEFSSDLMDYSLRPVDNVFGDLCLWQFMERTVKVRGKIQIDEGDRNNDYSDSDLEKGTSTSPK